MHLFFFLNKSSGSIFIKRFCTAKSATSINLFEYFIGRWSGEWARIAAIVRWGAGSLLSWCDFQPQDAATWTSAPDASR